MKVPVDEFDGKVVYGQKKKATSKKKFSSAVC
jgi:hypothetical protein